MKLHLFLILLVFSCHNAVHSGSLSDKIDGFDFNFGDILEKLNGFKKEFEEIKEEIKQLKKEGEDFKRQLQVVASRITSNFRKTDVSSTTSNDCCFTSVVFGAELTANQSELGVVKFDRVKANIGNGYDKNTGEFTAPEDGVYYFTAIATNIRGSVAFYIRHGNQMTPASMMSNDEKDHTVTIGTNVLLELKKAEKIWVYLRSGEFSGSKEHTFTSFTGFRLA